MCVLIFKPPETLPERPFDFSFNRVDFIASNPLLPQELRIIKTPWLCSWLPFLEFKISCSASNNKIHVGLRGWTIWNAIGPEIMRWVVFKIGPFWSISTVVSFYLHISLITVCVWSWSWSVVSHGVLEMMKKKREIWVLERIEIGRSWSFEKLYCCLNWIEESRVSCFLGKWYKIMQEK